MKKIIALLLALTMVFALMACGSSAETTVQETAAPEATEEVSNEDATTAVCYNGKFVGAYEEETGVLSFKGIPYAQPPVGELRWKAPVAVEASDETYEATEFGYSSIQYYWFSEDITTEVSEDCLTLNVWTKDLSGSNKPVMVFFHGGSYAWGGTSEPLYNGQYIVNEHEDVIVVTCNYRIGMLGFIDLSNVPGGEEYEDSIQCGLLDAVESLRWIKQNIAAFGGDPENITIFGESAGGGLVSCLLASEYAGELFQRVIAESGTLAQCNTREQAADNDQAAILMEISGCTNMEELMALTEEEIIEYNEYPLDEDGTCLNEKYSLPYNGGNSIVPEDPYAALANAKAKGVDLLIGSNEDEANYWIAEMLGKELDEQTDEEIELSIEYFTDYFIEEIYQRVMNKLDDQGKADIAAYMALYPELDEVWAKCRVVSDYMFRASAIRQASTYSEAEGTGSVYMYLFEKDHSKYDCIGACHACELNYVFHNLNYSSFSGEVDEGLADQVCEAWVNFAKTGDPSTSTVEWPEYDTTDRYTMIMTNDCTMEVESDPLSQERVLGACMGMLQNDGGNGV